MALIHVVIPVYNAKQFLRETVASVLGQPCKDIDIVLVDDGSTDGSDFLCDEIASQEERVTVIHQENGGVSAARNAGIEYFLQSETQGYLSFLDADDLWVPGVMDNTVEGKLHQMEQTDVFVFGGTASNEDCSRYAIPHRYQEESFEGGSGIIWKVQGHFCANLYSLQLLREYGIRFIEGLKYGEDKIFRLQNLFLARCVTFLPEVLHIYRENSTSAMRKIHAYSPISYYTAIIDGWVASDLFLNQYKQKTGKTTDAGSILASIYFMDMAMDHHKQWRKPRDLERVKSHPYYYLFEHMRENCVSPEQYKDYKLLMRHPLYYRWKYRAIGAIESAVRLAMRIKYVRQFREKRKYPLMKQSAPPQKVEV